MNTIQIKFFNFKLPNLKLFCFHDDKTFKVHILNLNNVEFLHSCDIYVSF
jgi:hypothetical protein